MRFCEIFHGTNCINFLKIAILRKINLTKNKKNKGGSYSLGVQAQSEAQSAQAVQAAQGHTQNTKPSFGSYEHLQAKSQKSRSDDTNYVNVNSNGNGGYVDMQEQQIDGSDSIVRYDESERAAFDPKLPKKSKKKNNFQKNEKNIYNCKKR